jgi:(2Fe-2S) ferredoxin
MTISYEVWVCQNRSCLAQGAAAVLQAFEQQLVDHPVAQAIACDCQGQCNMSTTVRVITDETWYCRIQPEQVAQIIQAHFIQGEPVQSLLHPRFHPRF